MATLLFEFIALLIFWKLGDFKRFWEFLPLIIFACFIRFLDHFVVINWFRFWEIKGGLSSRLWLPISADLTTWPIISYLFIQYFPFQTKWIQQVSYGSLFVVMMFVYMQILRFLGVVSFQKGWHVGHSILLISGYFLLMYGVGRWLKLIGNKKQYVCG